MDKAEYKIATEHIKKLISQGEYAEASYIADTIDWRRVKSVMMLCTVSDLYKVNRRYQDAKELLYMAYERNPESRTILYSLCDLSIKLEEFVAAIEYYKSFVEVAPKDTGRYVLQYRLYQAQDVGLEERIEVLEQLKSEEYIEKWAYELAYLYHRIGFATKCVEECDELILWFGKGRYVYKAMELKMLHEPLSPFQQQIYDHRFEHMEQAKDMTRVLPRIDSGDTAMTEEGMVDVTDAPTVEIPQEYLEKELHISAVEQSVVAEDIQVKTLDVANAYNTMNLQKELADSLREILEVSHTESSLDLTEQNTSEYEDNEETSEDHVWKDTDEAQEPEEVLEAQQENVVALEAPIEVISKQISIQQIMPDVFQIGEQESDMVNEQITGQLSIEDVLSEWSRQEEQVMEARQEEISARIKSQTQDIFAAIEAEMKRDILEDIDISEEATEVVPDSDWTGTSERKDVETTELVQQQEIFDNITEEEAEAVQEKVEDNSEQMELTEDHSQAIEDATAEAKDKEAEQPGTLQAEDYKALDTKEEVHASPVRINGNIYKSFIRSVDTEAQISIALSAVSMTAKEGNVRVTGHDLSVCSEFIKTMMTDLKGQGFLLKGKTAKISAVNLNKKEPSEIISKVQNGVLIIERAGRLRKETVDKLQKYLYAQELSVLVFMTDTEQGMKHFIEKYPIIGELFPIHVDIKDYSEDELVAYAQKYAYENEYSIEEMGELALRTRIEEMIANEDAPTMENARNIIDSAIDHANRKNFKHFMDVLLHKRYDAEDMIILREEDFF